MKPNLRNLFDLILVEQDSPFHGAVENQNPTIEVWLGSKIADDGSPFRLDQPKFAKPIIAQSGNSRNLRAMTARQVGPLVQDEVEIRPLGFKPNKQASIRWSDRCCHFFLWKLIRNSMS